MATFLTHSKDTRATRITVAYDFYDLRFNTSMHTFVRYAYGYEHPLLTLSHPGQANVETYRSFRTLHLHKHLTCFICNFVRHNFHTSAVHRCCA